MFSLILREGDPILSHQFIHDFKEVVVFLHFKINSSCTPVKYAYHSSLIAYTLIIVSSKSILDSSSSYMIPIGSLQWILISKYEGYGLSILCPEIITPVPSYLRFHENIYQISSVYFSLSRSLGMIFSNSLSKLE